MLDSFLEQGEINERYYKKMKKKMKKYDKIYHPEEEEETKEKSAKQERKEQPRIEKTTVKNEVNDSGVYLCYCLLHFFVICFLFGILLILYFAQFQNIKNI